MDELEELRYPWDNSVQFWIDGYFSQIAALHLVAGGLLAILLISRVLIQSEHSMAVRCSILYFSLTVFTNPAFGIVGLSVNEVFGVGAIVLSAVQQKLLARSSFNTAVVGLLVLFLAGLSHAILVAAIYPSLLTSPSTALLKFAVNAKIFVLAVNLALIAEAVTRDGGLDSVARSIVAGGVIGLFVYSLQIAMMASGIVPYGTYLDAGFVGVPSFGSVSVERGHFGKFMASYYPFFLYSALTHRKRWPFFLLMTITLINFSASSQVYFVVFVALAFWTFKTQIKKLFGVSLLLFAFMFAAVLLSVYADVFTGLITKIYDLAIEGQEGGGRDFGTFYQYISTYPLGTGYGGSTFRTAPLLPEINAAHYALISQYSILALPIICFYLVLLWRSFLAQRRGTLVQKTMAVGVAMTVLVFLTDILWFVPLFWLPFVVLLQGVTPSAHRSTQPVPRPLAQ